MAASVVGCCTNFLCSSVLAAGIKIVVPRDLLGIVVQPLDLHLVNVRSIPSGPTHGEGRLQEHPRDEL